MDGVNLQCPVDDALNLVHDVVLCKQVLEIPEKSHSLKCFKAAVMSSRYLFAGRYLPKTANMGRYLLAGSPGNAMVALQ